MKSDYIFQNKEVTPPYLPKYRSQFIAGVFIHYYRGSNWDEQQPNFHTDKLDFFEDFLNNPDQYNINLTELVHYDKAHANKGWEGKDNNNRAYRFTLMYKK